jgi:transcriptional regulator with XRE-family HTH domain
MSQKDLAATVGRSHSMISGIESGARQIHVDELVTFAKALHVPASALLGDTDGDLYRRGFNAGWAAAMGQARDFALSRMFEPDIQPRATL